MRPPAQPYPTLRVGAVHVIVNGQFDGHVGHWVESQDGRPPRISMFACPAHAWQEWHVDDVDVYSLTELKCPAGHGDTAWVNEE